MRGVARRAVAAILALAPLAAGVPVARGAAADDGALAPDGCWPVEDGSLARTGAAETAALKGRLATAWTWTPTGTIEGEPRVWETRVFVVDRVAPAKAFLRVLSLAEGKESFALALEGADAPVEPAVWDDAVVARTSRSTLRGWAVDESGLTPTWAREGGPFGPPLLRGREVYVREGDRLERLTLGSKDVAWGIEVRPVDALALRGDEVYATQARPDGGVDLVAVARRGGRVLRRVDVGAPSTTPAAEDVHVRVGIDLVVVEHGADVRGARRGVGSVWVDRRSFAATSTATAALLGPVAMGATGGIALVDDAQAGPRLLGDIGNPRAGELGSVTLATPASHPEFVPRTGAPTIANGVVHLGASAFDGSTKEVVRFDERPFRRRSIPATGRLLVVNPTGRLLTALEEEDAESRRPWAFQPPAYVLPADAAVVRADGSVTRGAFRFDPASRSLLPEPAGATGTRIPLAEVAAVVASNGRLLAARDVARAAKGLAAYGRNEHARGGGAGGPADAVWAAAAALPSTTRARTKCDFVRATLDLDPAHPAAVAWVRSALPAGTHLTRAFDPREWIDFVEAATETRVRMVDVPPGRESGLDAGRRALAAARRSWRPDLVALETGRLFLLTPLEKPARLAPLLSTGELACDTLERIFAVGRSKRDRLEPLVHHLYESREEYLAQSTKADAGKARAAHQQWLANTAGYYDSGDRISRFFPWDPTSDATTRGIYVHELTHHWIDVRCPLFRDEDRAGRPDQPGYWVAEGFAVLVQEFLFDLGTRSVTTLDPRAESLQTVAGVEPASLIPWDRLFEAPSLAGLRSAATVPLSLRSRLGAKSTTSEVLLFYAQAGAVCHWAFETSRRPALLQMIADYYTGAVKPGHVKALFGMEPKALGAAVQSWARDMTRRQ